ncbi:MAG TPA: ribonuclease D [Burkholderiales bacterium]
MTYVLVDDGAALARVCAALANKPWVTLDTEFTRERTFYARLGLLQLATDDGIACVDPLRVDLGPLLDVLFDPRLLKILHAGRQDLEVFYDLRGEVLAPVFDTQIAAALLGYAEQIGYAGLVEAITGVKLAKLHTRANWEARPLTEDQLHYAADDVAYLRDVYRALRARLIETGRLEWQSQECAALTNPQLYRSDPETAHLRLGAGNRLRVDAQPLLRALAAWRERTAKTRDRPRGWIAADAELIEIARMAPATVDALRTVPGITATTVNKHGEEILRVVRAAGDAAPELIWPTPDSPTQAQQDTARRMLERIKSLADAQSISPGIIATRRSVVELIRHRRGPLAEGWRRELIGAELLAMAGEPT